MRQKETRIVVGLIALVILAWLVAPLVGRRREPIWIFPHIQRLFDSGRAMNLTREYVARYPRRVIGSFEARQSTGYLRDQLLALGYKISYLQFDATVYGLRRTVGRNVLAFKAGQTSDIVAVVAHYDTATTTFQGATDDGSGIGVMLELARLFSSSNPHRSMLFVASDGTEWGMLGTRDLVRNYPDREKLVAVLSLDSLCSGDLAGLSLESTGQMSGYTPPWLRQVARTIAEQDGIQVFEAFGLREHLMRALPISWHDQGPFLNAGIPAVNLGSQSKDPSRDREIYHSDQDTVDNLKLETMEKYGRAAEGIVRALDALPTAPREPMGAFGLNQGTFLTPEAMLTLHYFSFLPFVAVVLFQWRNHRNYLNLGRLLRELLAFVATIFPFVLVYYSTVFFSLMRLLPRYSLYPATAKDPVLEHPRWGIFMVIMAIGIVSAVACYFLARLLARNVPRPDFPVSKLVALLLLFVVVVLALRYNEYWALTFLILPAWICALTGSGTGPGARAANRIFILLSGLPFYVIVAQYSARLFLGWNVPWYGVLALSTGLFTLKGYLLTAAAIALTIRFLTIQSQSRTNTPNGDVFQKPPQWREGHEKR